MKTRLTLFVTFFLFITIGCYAQTLIKEVYSEELVDKVEIQLSLPKDYSDSETRYPVLCILDGQWFFPHGVSVQADYTQRSGPKTTSDFIVVGITIDNSKRWEWTVEKTDQFLGFIEKELFLHVDTTFRSSQERILFGWEATGGFIFKALSQKPDLFDAYLAASPTPLYGTYFSNLEKDHKDLESFLINNTDLDKFLYVGEGESDYPAHYGMKVLSGLLKEKAPEKFRWQHDKLIGVSHQMTAYETLRRGIKAYYHYYHFLEYTSIAEFKRLGGLAYMEAFYVDRVTKMGLQGDEESRHATRRNLTFVAISENDYATFDFLFEKFQENDLLEKSFVPHANSYAQFYLKHNNTNKALEIIDLLIAKYPDNAMVYNSLGDIYLVLDRKGEAKKNYSKAVVLAEKNDDWRLEEYKEELNDLNHRMQVK